ncbi:MULTISPECIES: hypothetical protein [unclassified Agrobacterium]
MYKWAGVIHRDVGAMTLWEFACAQDGFRIANRSSEAAAPAMDDATLSELGIEGF